MNTQGQTISLNMIVKNEAPVIQRCLASVRPIIDQWVIVDTGSTDGTQALVREAMADLPGALIERPWVDFAHNRNEALAAARGRCDYILLIDADDTLAFDEGFALPALRCDAYHVAMHHGPIAYHRKQLVRSALPWRYTGVVHEYIHCDEARTEAVLSGLHMMMNHDGARARDPLTYRREALVLERALLEEPDNARYVFYLAQTYRDAGDLELALRHYRRRAAMGGWADEAWCARYQAALLEERLGRPWPEVLAEMLAAFQFHPDRAEPLYQIGLHYQGLREYHAAHLFLARAMGIPFPSGNCLFVERSVYDYLLPMEYAVACYYVGDHAAAVATNDRLLASGALPDHLIDQVTRNRQFSIDALSPAVGRTGDRGSDLTLAAMDPIGCGTKRTTGATLT
jgi:glycosyltransferase involved in cell wall biosynthesis